MPRARSAESIEAEELYRSGMKLVDIAQKMNVPPGTVRRWKSDQDWDGNKTKNGKKKETERSVIKPNAKPNVRKRGAQPGHPPQGGAPVGRANAATTGVYSTLYANAMTPEELAFMEEMTVQGTHRRDSLTSHLAVLRIREARLMKDVEEIRNGAEQLIRRTVSQIEPTGTNAADGRERTKVVRISQEQETRREMLLRFEDALTRIQAEIRRTEDSLQKISEAEYKRVDKDIEASVAAELNALAAMMQYPEPNREIPVQEEGDDDE